jgi:hypothetical protein
MVDQLKGLFGGGSKDDDDNGNEDARTAKLADFAKRYKDGDPNDGYDEDEAKAQLQQVLKKASPEQLQAAVRKTYENLPENQRAELAEMIEKGEGLVKIQRTSDGDSSTATAGAASGGGDPLSELFGGMLGGGGGGDLGGLLGGLLGGGGSGGGGGLGGLLGGLLGGGKKADADANTSATASGGAGLDDLLGSILSGPQGKAILGGIAAFAADAMSGGNDKK